MVGKMHLVLVPVINFQLYQGASDNITRHFFHVLHYQSTKGPKALSGQSTRVCLCLRDHLNSFQGRHLKERKA